ncbi:ankyrin repeat-containing domain, PGG domain protein [Artemisia annua]|uniref:Ankyrin repeat-containing domain, PGG domain protein n=1 Tax=Artemisia annua TaxID=35608 RepID=A0A2U1MIK5_ARTAN|nr:ankyrin repeat-containing domain, PGG domain protein [Artemisia annua]
MFEESLWLHSQLLLSVSAFVGLKARTPEKESDAVPLLRILWEDILTQSKRRIDDILRGPEDMINSGAGWVLQAIQLKELISGELEELENTYRNIQDVPHLKKLVSRYVIKMMVETRDIISEEKKTHSSKGDHALELEKIISENISKLHDDTQKVKKSAAGVKSLHGLIKNHISVMRKATHSKYTYSSRVMFIAAEVGNTNFLLELIRRSPDLIWKVNDNNQTIFHVAVKNRHEGIYNLLYEIGAMKDMVTPLKDSDGNNMLHLAAMSTRKKNLEDVSGAALQMQQELLWFKEVERMIPPSYRERLNNDGLTPRELFTKEHQDLITQAEKWMKATASQCMVVATLIATIVFAPAFTVPGGYNQNDGIPMFKRKLEEKKTHSSKGDHALELEKIISENISKLHDDTQKVKKSAAGVKSLHGLIKNHISVMRKATHSKYTYSSRVMFIAAEVGNTNFLLELIRRSPDLIWKVNDNNQTIFHVAVKNRHEGIYNLLYEIGAMKDMVTPLKDSDGNNMLHLAAMSTRKKNLEDVSGAALQMQQELLWFKEVERMIPPSYRERLNNDGLTPRELFTKEHQDLITQAEKWMKATASQCMVVATLIATIVFAPAFTVPGGYNQNDGIPMFKRKLSFVAFVVADAISLFLSSASILTFLSILTSRYAEHDFVRSLPLKLMSGLAAIFLSIGTMMVTFSVSFFVLYHKEMKWIPIFISLFAITPAILYVALQYHLLIDVFRSTYGGKYLFKPEKQVLFYENPKY